MNIEVIKQGNLAVRAPSADSDWKHRFRFQIKISIYTSIEETLLKLN